MRSFLYFVCILVSVLADGVCGPMFTSNCSQFNTATTCTCAPDSTVQSCSRQATLQYFTFDAASQTFMYCQWQFSAFAGGIQCGRGSTCTPSMTPALQVCQSNLQAQTSQATDLQANVSSLKQQLVDAQLNASRLQRQLEQATNENQMLRLELAKKGIITVDLQHELDVNLTRDLLLELQANETIKHQDNVTYYQRLICGTNQGCCHYSAAMSLSPLWGVFLGFVLFACRIQ